VGNSLRGGDADMFKKLNILQRLLTSSGRIGFMRQAMVCTSADRPKAPLLPIDQRAAELGLDLARSQPP
jgi:hypothetical protein